MSRQPTIACGGCKTKNTSLVPFNKQKLFVELYRACEHRRAALDDATALTDTVIGLLRQHTAGGLLNSQVIAQTTYGVLQRFDKAASVYYEARHL